ncbi:procathepsin L-like [Babylonia areolata]|uniref:procathepsin L-like n=1 Tax=Babylonia areolata TaxID=304850 RepID=UPI003FD3351F
MHTGLFVLCLAAAAYALPNREIHRSPFKLRFDPYEATWTQFKKTHGKNYTLVEEAKRRSVFMDNVKRIEEHNWHYFQKTKSYYLGINQFTDLTEEEYKQYNRLMKQRVDDKKKIHCTEFMTPLNWFVPPFVNWTAKGYVTPVKNQGQCGSCWSFSTTGSLEGQHFRQTGKLVSLSEQQLVDCSSSFGNQGCNGGLMDQAFEYIYSAGGLETESEYPYDAMDERCKFIKSEVAATLTGCKDIPSEDEDMLTKAVASQGPVSVAIDAGHSSFQMYAGGVYDEPECSTTQLDHGVLVVGYGSLEGQEYWLVKNSWGTSWGDQGYIMMSRNKENQCGIATSASFPVV